MKTIDELKASLREKADRLGELSEVRELNDAQKAEVAQLEREYKTVSRQLECAIREAQAAALAKPAPKKTAAESLREILKGARGASREIVLGTGENGDVRSSGAIALDIKDMIPTLNEGLGLPKGATLVSGVIGDEVWPVSLDDAEIEEVGETAALSDQDLTFANIKPTSARAGLSIVVSNTAIDNAEFDLLGFVQQKFTLALKKYLAKKLYSQAQWTGAVKGPFSGLAKAGDITIGANAFKEILVAIAGFTAKGYDADQVCLVLDAATEAELKATPKATGQGGFVIEGGKCAGYDYVVSHYINTTLNSAGKLVPTADRYIGIGLFNYEAIQQHGQVRFGIDNVSKAVQTKNVTALVLNTAFSMTDLSKKQTTNGTKNETTQAFALYKVVEPEPSEG